MHLSFQKFSRGDTPGPSQRVGPAPSRTQHPAWPLAGHGAQAPQCWDPNLGPSQLFSRGCIPTWQHADTIEHQSGKYSLTDVNNGLVEFAGRGGSVDLVFQLL